MINYLLPTRAATVQTLGHPAAGVIGWFDSTTNTSGVSVDYNTALTFSAVWCAVRVISETLATLPCVLYRRTSDDGRERATDDRRYTVVHDEPHPLMSAVNFFETMTAQMVLRGNCYARIVQRQGGELDRLELRNPDMVTPEVDGERIRYTISDPREIIYSDEMLHIAGLGGDGLVGWSVIKYGQQSIGGGMAADTYAAAQMGNGATPKGLLKFPTRLDKEARDKFRKDWDEQHKGGANAGKVAILHGGMEYQAISMTNEDAQLLQSRQFSVREIARWFRLPPHMLADLADSSVRANIEQQAMEFITYSMAPWLVRWQQALNRKLLAEEERKEMFFEFLLNALLRGDAQSRFGAYATGRQWGWLSVNDIRRLENMNLIDGGDVYLQPSNMVPADSDLAKGEKPDPPAPPPGFGAPPPEDEEEPPADDEEVPDSARAELQRNWAQSMNAILNQGKQLNQEMITSGMAALDKANETITHSLLGLREVRDEIKADIAAPRKTQVQGWQPDVTAFADACQDLIQSHLECLQKMERAEVIKAAKSVQRGQNFVDWMVAWYEEFEARVAGRIDSAVQCYAKVAHADDGLAGAIAAGYCAEHREQLLAAADGQPEQFAQRVQAVLDAWSKDCVVLVNWNLTAV